MDDDINDDGLGSEDFSDFLGKYNDYFDKNTPNQEFLSFLDKPEMPTDDDVIKLFITKDDFANSLDITNYDLDDLGPPHAIKTLEGVEWKVSKLVPTILSTLKEGKTVRNCTSLRLNMVITDGLQ